ncbi:ribokinase [Conyzicola lurida]|uniref:Ribokinase n=1 Tax=Conyzicola lurida TaxID=1172621 RepID=A0A841AR22_9MICO|nr:ribokinase [Conyzicola lurida]MBB5844748.1 ribokinase [Conyzicola lurida]
MPSASPTPVIVVGSVNMDLLFTGLAAFPKPGQTVTSETFRIVPGGKGANQAAAAARLGGDVRFVAAIGTDELGDQAWAALDAEGVNLDSVARVDAPTGVAAVVIDTSGENSIIINPGANALVSGADAAATAAPFAGKPAVVLACLEVPVDTVTAWARVARSEGWTFILNPAPAPAEALPAELLALVDILTPNDTELEALGSVESLQAVGVGTVIVTRGGDGADLVAPGEAPHHQDAFPARPVDTTGAGDSFNGALAVALAEGQTVPDALRFAAATGALSTRAIGARDGLPTRAEVNDLLAV